MFKAFSFFAFGFMCCLSLKAQSTAPTFDVQHYRFAIQLTDANDTVKGQAKIQIRFFKDVNSFQLDLEKQKSAAADSASNAGSEHVRGNKKASLAGKGMLVSSVTEDDKA